ncbi:hypothetical protein HZA57_01030, partial [Candidatus Poribacteria bacterium]|nr:hypothetical protein [Candidatus Poribacteria bacterium]
TGPSYDVYMYMPPNVRTDQTILASLDVLNIVEGKDLNSPVSLDHFTLEEIEILP